jgi:uncharacterized protein YjiS (DUF1127 family)
MFMPALGTIRSLGGTGGERLAAEPNGVLAGLGRKLAQRVQKAIRYRRALWELNQLDDRDLDDLALGRGDLPALAWRHAQSA